MYPYAVALIISFSLMEQMTTTILIQTVAAGTGYTVSITLTFATSKGFFFENEAYCDILFPGSLCSFLFPFQSFQTYISC